ncbi:MAG: hypothetical protein U1E17_04485 [Geminicoccaceae bacterium]
MPDRGLRTGGCRKRWRRSAWKASSAASGALSGGQLQRVLFARLLLQDARVLLLGKPFTARSMHARR